MNLSKDEMDFLDNVVFSKEYQKTNFEEWVYSFELYLKEDGRELLL